MPQAPTYTLTRMEIAMRSAATAAVLCLLFVATHASVHIANQKFYVDDHEFYVKGMAYQPTPLGIKPMQSTGYDGGGLCSAKLTPYDEWKSACYDYDFFDGSASSPGREPPGPDSWFASLWSRDLPALKEMGVNTLRLYSMNPLTEKATKARVGAGGIVHAYGKNHVPFFDAAHAAGMKIMAPLLASDLNVLLNDDDETWQRKVADLIDEVGSHPALLAWYLGSDWGLESPQQSNLLEKLKRVFTYTKSHTSVPLTYCVSDLPTKAKFYADSGLPMDFVCANAGWSGPRAIASFVAGDGTSTSWSSAAKDKGWPIVIGEAGYASLNDSFTEQSPTWFAELWKQTLDLDAQGVVGSIYFEYSDEPYGRNEWMRTNGAVSLKVAVDGINNSTQPNVFWADDLVRKPTVFDSIKSGTINDATEMNYNMDLYKYLARSPTTNQGQAIVPKSNGSTGLRAPSTSTLLQLFISLFVLAFAAFF